MPRNQEMVTCPPNVWTQLNSGPASNITFQITNGAVKIRCTTGAPPANLNLPGYVYHARPGEWQQISGELNIPVSDLANAAGNTSVYATPINGRVARVVVDHA
jgi:hypothetical protein